MQVCAFLCTNLVIQKLLLSQWTFSCSKYSVLSPQKPRDGYDLIIHITVNHICNNNFNIIFPSTAKFNMWPLYMKFLTFDLPGAWNLLQHLFSAKRKCYCFALWFHMIITLILVTHNNEHLILPYCTVSQTHSTCYVNFYLKQCKFWECNSYCDISNLSRCNSVSSALCKRQGFKWLNVIPMTVAVIWRHGITPQSQPPVI